jgi:hypothetical protein
MAFFKKLLLFSEGLEIPRVWSPRLVTEALKYQLISCTNENVVNGLVGVGIPKTLIMEETLLQILVVVMMM